MEKILNSIKGDKTFEKEPLENISKKKLAAYKHSGFCTAGYKKIRCIKN